MEDIIRQYIDNIYIQKDTLIKLRIIERVGIDIDFYAESKKRFKKIAHIIHEHDNSEHYYYDDGSDKGLHLISFYNSVPSLNNDFNIPFTFK